MEDEATKLLRQILDVQKEQTELLRKHLGRIRFSLRTLLLLLSLVSVALGFLMYEMKSTSSAAPPPPILPPVPQRIIRPPQILPESTPKRTIGFLNLQTNSLI
jgi:hypothetical protein